VHIVTPEFADNAIANFENLNGSSSIIAVAGVRGIKYEYEYSGIPRIAIDIPFGEYRLLLGADKDFEGVFNQIISSFKFLK
jgi:hypothetical protein